MHLLLIRHAQSTNNALDDETLRHYDCDLTDLGFRQADRLAAYLAAGAVDPSTGDGSPITRLYTSPMRRTLQTTRPLAAALELAPQVWVDLHETGGVFLETAPDTYTGYPGMGRAQMLREFPGYVLQEEVTETGWWDPALGKESLSAEYRRAIAVSMALWAQAASDERIALVTHGGFMGLLLEALLGQLPRNGRPQVFHHANTAITRLELSTEGWLYIRYSNRLDHLPLDLRSP